MEHTKWADWLAFAGSGRMGFVGLWFRVISVVESPRRWVLEVRGDLTCTVLYLGLLWSGSSGIARTRCSCIEIPFTVLESW